MSNLVINIKYYSKIKSDWCVRCMHKNMGFARALQRARAASSNDQMSAFRNDVWMVLVTLYFWTTCVSNKLPI
jgi:hypothetical protein